MEELIDLSHIIEKDMPVHPDDIRTNLFQIKYLESNEYNDHRLDISMHSGTHIDSPMHMGLSKQYIHQAPINSFVGNGCILDVRNQIIIKMKEEYKRIVKENTIVLLYTGHDEFYGESEYYKDHPVVGDDFCRFLIEKKIKMLGVDMPSPDRYPFQIHKALFKNNIYIMENLTNLNRLMNIERFEILAFPLKIKADSSITRAVARVIK